MVYSFNPVQPLSMSQNDTDSHRLVAYLESTESRVFEIVIHLCVGFRVANLVLDVIAY